MSRASSLVLAVAAVVVAAFSLAAAAGQVSVSHALPGGSGPASNIRSPHTA